ncbi:beta-lactamase family protein [bacterium]|nr:beta-lactamase family protein [bacterium]
MPNQTIRPLLENAREGYLFSAYQLAALHGTERTSLAGGKTSYWPGASAVDETTLFDIGSVTKAVVTVSLFARALDSGRMALTQAVQHWLPELAGTALGPLVLSDLLSHAAGLRGWLPLYKQPIPADRRSWMAHAAGEWVERPVGEKAVYSDLGFIILGEAVASAFHAPLAQAFRQEVAAPLGLTQTVYGPVPKAVATEVREGVPLQGIVFDENCAALGGTAGHAGLFSTALDLGRWAEAWLQAWQGKSPWLSQKTARLLTTRVGKVASSAWALGWDTPSAPSSSGNYFSSESFGHLGYPGCSVWVDPKRGGYVVFLSNRVHPSRLDERIRRFRPQLHDAVTQAW